MRGMVKGWIIYVVKRKEGKELEEDEKRKCWQSFDAPGNTPISLPTFPSFYSLSKGKINSSSSNSNISIIQVGAGIEGGLTLIMFIFTCNQFAGAARRPNMCQYIVHCHSLSLQVLPATFCPSTLKRQALTIFTILCARLCVSFGSV